MKSKNIIFTGKQCVHVIEEDVPPPQAGQLLCAATKSLISVGTETFCLRGTYDAETTWEHYIRYPFHPGYSMSAVVLEVGEGVKTFQRGDRITAWVGHRQHFIVKESEAFPIPDEISDEAAAWATLARTTQLGVRRAALQLGETVGVVGLGMLGQLVVQYLRVSGARRIIAIDPLKVRIDMAMEHGATDGFPVHTREALESIQAATGGRMLDAIFDVTGHPAVLAPATQALRKLGRLILLGDSPTPSLQQLGPRVVGDSIAIMGIHGMMVPEAYSVYNPWTAAEMNALFFEYLRQGRMNVSDLITHPDISPLDAPAVYRWLLEDRSTAMGVTFEWGAV